MTHPKTRFPVDRGRYLCETLAAARNRVRDLEIELNEYLRPAPEPVSKPDPDFEAMLAYWQRNGPPQLSLHDEKPAFKSMADGEMYTSSKKYRDEIKARGYEEIGDEREAFDKIGEIDEKAYIRQLQEDINQNLGDTFVD